MRTGILRTLLSYGGRILILLGVCWVFSVLSVKFRILLGIPILILALYLALCISFPNRRDDD
jgi:hypothetical protein